MTKSKLSTWLFSISYLLLMFSDMFSNVRYCKPFLALASYLAICTLMIVFLLQTPKYRKSTIIFIAVFATIVCLINLRESQKNLIYILLLVMSFKHVDYDSFMKKTFLARLLFFGVIIASSLLGLTQDYNMYRKGGFIRYSLGFAHPNRLAACVVQLVLELLYLKRTKINRFYSLITFIAAGAILTITDSRSAFAILILLGITIFFNKFIQEKVINLQVVKKSLIALPIVLTLGSILVSNMFLSGNEFLAEVNRKSTGRIKLMANAYQSGGLTLFGRSVDAVDNVYIQMLSKDGILFISIFLGMYMVAINKNYKEKNKIMIIILGVYLVYGLVESYLLRVTYNAFIISFGYLLYPKNQEEEEKI